MFVNPTGPPFLSLFIYSAKAGGKVASFFYNSSFSDAATQLLFVIPISHPRYKTNPFFDNREFMYNFLVFVLIFSVLELVN